MIIIETTRLSMRQMTENDVPHLMKIFADPIAMQYYKSTKTEEDAVNWIHWNLRNYKEDGAGLWICELKENGQFVGQCGIVPQVVDEVAEKEIGYLFAREFWGNGYATEAALASREFGFSTLGLNRLISMINPLNQPSIRVAERIGMTLEKETIIRERPTLIYSIERE